MLRRLINRRAAIRDSRGRFLRGNPYRLSVRRVSVNGRACKFVMQDPLYGRMFKAVERNRP